MARKRPNRSGTRRAVTRAVDWKPVFLKAYAEGGVIVRACKVVGVHRDTVNDHLHKDPDFAKAFKAASHAAWFLVRDELHRRAVEGVLRKKFTKGGAPIIDPATKEQYVELEYSDQLLKYLDESLCPDEFRPTKQVDMTSGGQPVKVLIGVNPDDV